MNKKSKFERSNQNHLKYKRNINNDVYDTSSYGRSTLNGEHNSYNSKNNYSTGNNYYNSQRFSSSNASFDKSRSNGNIINGVLKLPEEDIQKMTLLTENINREKYKKNKENEDKLSKSKKFEFESLRNYKINDDVSRIIENGNKKLSLNLLSTKGHKISNELETTPKDKNRHKRKSLENNSHKRFFETNESERKSQRMTESEITSLILNQSEKISSKVDESEKKSSKAEGSKASCSNISSTKSSCKRKITTNNVNNVDVVNKKIKSASIEVIKCDDVFKRCQLNNSITDKILEKDSKVETKLSTSHIVPLDSMIHEVETLEIPMVNINKNWKYINDLDNKIIEENKSIKAQKELVMKLKTDYENELKKLNEMRDRKISDVNERERIFNELKTVEQDSSDDDLKIIEVVEEKNIITVSSSSESESESSDVLDIRKSKVPNETKSDAKQKINNGVQNQRCISSPQSMSHNNGESFQLLLSNIEKSTVEPTLDSILVNKQHDSYITDLKVFDNRLFVGVSYGILRQYDMKTHECVMEYFGHSTIIHSIYPTISAFGIKQLFSGGYDNKLIIHNIQTADVIYSFATCSPIMSICESNDMVYAGTSNGHIYVYSLRGQCAKKDFAVSEGIACISSIKEGMKSLLFVGTNSGEVSVWDADTYQKLRNISVQDHVGVPIGFVTLVKQRLLVYSKNSIHFIYYASEKSPVTFNHFSKNSSLCQTKNYTIIGNNLGTIFVLRTNGSIIAKTPVVTYNNADSAIVSLTFYNNTIISGDKKGNIYFNRLIET